METVLKQKRKLSRGGRIAIIIAAVLVALSLCFSYMLYASFSGHPITRLLVTNQARQYVSEHFPGEPYEVEFARYDFKCMGYFCMVQSTESEDTRFTVQRLRDGSLTDFFDTEVNGRQNTLARLSRSLDDYADAWFAANYPYRTTLVLADCYGSHNEALLRSRLTLDMPFDPMQFPLDAELTVWVETQNGAPTWEELEERLTELEQLTREAFPMVTRFSINLQNPYTVQPDGGLDAEQYEGSISVFDIPREVITGDGLHAYLAAERATQEEELAMIKRGEDPRKDESHE